MTDRSQATPVFQLSVVNQNDPINQGEGLEAKLVSWSPKVSLRGNSAPISQWVPVPPNSPAINWFFQIGQDNVSIEDFNVTVQIKGSYGGYEETISIACKEIPGWVSANYKEKTNQIYKPGTAGTFGYAQCGPDGYIYTLTGGVDDPKIHPGGKEPCEPGRNEVCPCCSDQG